MARVLFPIPSQDFDPTEVAVPWSVLTALGHQVFFATPDGKPGAADPIMLDGIGLDPWSLFPGLRNVRLLGLILRANAAARAAYARLVASPEFQRPLHWDDIHRGGFGGTRVGPPKSNVGEFDGLILAGGHRARGMRPYLESSLLQARVAEFFEADKPVGAICHGVLLAARSRTASGCSVLYGRQTTALTWSQERTADALARIGRFWDPNYYRTYLESAGQPRGYMSVEAEVKRALARPEDFRPVSPFSLRKTCGIFRDSLEDTRSAWVVQDGNYVSARWPGDAHLFARTFAGLLAH